MRKKAVLVGLGLLGLGLLASAVIFFRYVTSPRESRARVLAADVATCVRFVAGTPWTIGNVLSRSTNLSRLSISRKFHPTL